MSDLQKMSLQIEYIPTSELNPYKNNARKHENTDVSAIVSSIQEFGFDDPIGVWGDDNTIIEGHGRLMAAKKLKMKEVPCIRLDHLTDEQRRAYALAHNKTAELSEWDLDLLKIELDDIADIDMSEFGFDLDFDIDEPAEIVEDETPEPPEEPKTKLGDIYDLGGEHRLICGDSTDVNVIDRLMDGVKADMVFTDPPYGMLKESKGIKNDQLDSVHQRDKTELLKFNKKWIPISFEYLKSNGSWYCWGIDEPLMDIYSNILKPLINNTSITFRNLLTWNKGVAQGIMSQGFRCYPRADEKCLFVMKGWQSGFNNNESDYDDKFENIRSYIEDECKKCGINNAKAFNKILKCTNKYQHLVTKSHWYLMSYKDYKTLREYAHSININAFDKAYEDLEKEYNNLWAYFNNTHDKQTNVWDFPPTSGKERAGTGGHPTPKPIALCSRAIKSSSREGEIVLDVFGGSGSTLIACEQLNRKCYMCELSPRYCDVIVERWENFTGEKAKLIKGA